jgi:hypothetical protein
MNRTEPAFACDLTRMSSADRDRLLENSRQIFAQATEAKALPDGYALGFPQAPPELLAKIAAFMAYDRLCCTFLRHELVSEPYGGMTWLRLTGEPGVKEFIRTDLRGMLPSPLATAVVT